MTNEFQMTRDGGVVCKELLGGLERCAVWHHLCGIGHRDKRRSMENSNIGPPYPIKYETEHFAWAKQISEAIDILAAGQREIPPTSDTGIPVSQAGSTCDECGGPMPVAHTDERGAEHYCAKCAGVETPNAELSHGGPP